MFSGSIVALITPFNHDGEVDYVSLKKLVDYHVAAGSDGIVAVGTTGESSTLTIEEHVKVVMKTVEFAEGRIPVIAGTGANATHESVTFSRLLNNSGIAGCLSVTPYYNKPTQEGLSSTTKRLLKRATFHKSYTTCRVEPPLTLNLRLWRVCQKSKASLH